MSEGMVGMKVAEEGVGRNVREGDLEEWVKWS